jgi:hypothetical protein
MQAFERLLPRDEDAQTHEELVDENHRGYSKCFWISYSAFVFTVGAVSMWVFFKYVIMN